jgi:hypothetical protein
MRKIIQTTGMSPESFTPTIKVIMMEENQPPTTILEKELVVLKQPNMIYRNKEYSVEEYARIELCNSALISHNMPEMTADEADFMLSRADIRSAVQKKMNEDLEPESLQRLAGFSVEKIITPL